MTYGGERTVEMARAIRVDDDGPIAESSERYQPVPVDAEETWRKCVSRRRDEAGRERDRAHRYGFRAGLCNGPVVVSAPYVLLFALSGA